jgi:hypothetical protein
MDLCDAVITKREKGVNLILNQVIKNLEIQELRKAVSKLPEKDRLLVKYRYCDELTQQKIGNIFGISKMAVCKRLTKLHRELRESLFSALCVRAILLGALVINAKGAHNIITSAYYRKISTNHEADMDRVRDCPSV